MQICKQCRAEIPEDARICPYCQSEVKKDDDKQRRFFMKMRPRILAAQMTPLAPVLLPSPTPPPLPPTISRRSGALFVTTTLILISIIVLSFLQSPLPTLARGAKLEVRFPGSTSGTPGQTRDVVEGRVVSPLDFGTQNAGQKSIKTILISNSGTAQLKWNIYTARKTKWLSYDLASGTVEPGASFQTVTVTADTTPLIPGSYLTVLEVRSNGGTEDIKITMNVAQPSTGSTSPTPSPTTPTTTPTLPASSPTSSPTTLTTTPTISPTTSTTPTSLQKPILFIGTAQLTFGPVMVGYKPSQQITIRNSGGQTLQWQTSVNQEWITLDPSQNSNGLPAGQSQTINVIADTSQLSSNLSPYPGAITFISNGGTKTVSLTLNLVAPQAQPMLCLDTQTLDFGTLTVGDTSTQQITVSNCGGQSLTWNADTGNASWVTLDTATETLNAGDQQIINVTVATSTLATGSNPATISFSSNGGSKTVSITLTVIPVPTITPTLSLPCPYDVGTGWTCSGTVTPDANNQSDVTWMSSSSGINGIYVTPSGSTLPPGSPMSITISIPDGICPAAATIYIYSSATNLVSLPWSCPAPTLIASSTLSDCPPATATAIASTAIAATPATYLDCGTVTLTEDSNFQGGLSWNANSDISGVSFYPASGLLYPGNPVIVTIVVPNYTAGCFNFVGPANTASVMYDTRIK